MRLQVVRLVIFAAAVSGVGIAFPRLCIPLLRHFSLVLPVCSSLSLAHACLQIGSHCHPPPSSFLSRLFFFFFPVLPLSYAHCCKIESAAGSIQSLNVVSLCDVRLLHLACKPSNAISPPGSPSASTFIFPGQPFRYSRCLSSITTTRSGSLF